MNRKIFLCLAVLSTVIFTNGCISNELEGYYAVRSKECIDSGGKYKPKDDVCLCEFANNTDTQCQGVCDFDYNICRHCVEGNRYCEKGQLAICKNGHSISAKCESGKCDENGYDCYLEQEKPDVKHEAMCEDIKHIKKWEGNTYVIYECYGKCQNTDGAAECVCDDDLQQCENGIVTKCIGGTKVEIPCAIGLKCDGSNNVCTQPDDGVCDGNICRIKGGKTEVCSNTSWESDELSKCNCDSGTSRCLICEDGWQRCKNGGLQQCFWGQWITQELGCECKEEENHKAYCKKEIQRQCPKECPNTCKEDLTCPEEKSCPPECPDCVDGNCPSIQCPGDEKCDCRKNNYCALDQQCDLSTGHCIIQDKCEENSYKCENSILKSCKEGKWPTTGDFCNCIEDNKTIKDDNIENAKGKLCDSGTECSPGCTNHPDQLGIEIICSGDSGTSKECKDDNNVRVSCDTQNNKCGECLNGNYKYQDANYTLNFCQEGSSKVCSFILKEGAIWCEQDKKQDDTNKIEISEFSCEINEKANINKLSFTGKMTTDNSCSSDTGGNCSDMSIVLDKDKCDSIRAQIESTNPCSIKFENLKLDDSTDTICVNINDGNGIKGYLLDLGKDSETCVNKVTICSNNKCDGPFKCATSVEATCEHPLLRCTGDINKQGKDIWKKCQDDDNWQLVDIFPQDYRDYVYSSQEDGYKIFKYYKEGYDKNDFESECGECLNDTYKCEDRVLNRCIGGNWHVRDKDGKLWGGKLEVEDNEKKCIVCSPHAPTTKLDDVCPNELKCAADIDGLIYGCLYDYPRICKFDFTKDKGTWGQSTAYCSSNTICNPNATPCYYGAGKEGPHFTKCDNAVDLYTKVDVCVECLINDHCEKKEPDFYKGNKCSDDHKCGCESDEDCRDGYTCIAKQCAPHACKNGDYLCKEGGGVEKCEGKDLSEAEVNSLILVYKDTGNVIEIRYGCDSFLEEDNCEAFPTITIKGEDGKKLFREFINSTSSYKQTTIQESDYEIPSGGIFRCAKIRAIYDLDNIAKQRNDLGLVINLKNEPSELVIGTNSTCESDRCIKY